jgi:SRSO17 transposase
MVSGLLMELEDHNCWTIAEAAGHRGPHRLQHLLSRAVWDGQHLMDIAAAWAAGHLDDGDAVLIVDETADEKSPAGCAGAARQYSGTPGGVALCQVAVTLTYATSRGHALTGRALYLPGGCAADEEHRELAGVPEEVLFATKPQLAGALLDRAQSLGIRAASVAGDEVYGGRELRRSIRQRGMSYVLAVRATHTVGTGSGRTVTAAGAAGLIPARAWHRMRTGSGTKGTRHHDWAMLEVTSDDTPEGHDDGHSVLLARRHRYTGQLSYYRCWTPGPVPLSKLIAIASARWRIEEDHQLSKQAASLDAGQVIRWRSWHRWTAICQPSALTWRSACAAGGLRRRARSCFFVLPAARRAAIRAVSRDPGGPSAAAASPASSSSASSSAGSRPSVEADGGSCSPVRGFRRVPCAASTSWSQPAAACAIARMLQYPHATPITSTDTSDASECRIPRGLRRPVSRDSSTSRTGTAWPSSHASYRRL